MSETRTHVTFLYPGSLFPEEGRTLRIDNDGTATVLAASPDEHWFAAEVSIGEWERWTSESGEEKWHRTRERPTKFRIYVGERFTADDVAALPGDHAILLSNMRANDWPVVVRTRCGNWQPIEGDDVVLSAEEAAS